MKPETFDEYYRPNANEKWQCYKRGYRAISKTVAKLLPL